MAGSTRFQNGPCTVEVGRADTFECKSCEARETNIFRLYINGEPTAVDICRRCVKVLEAKLKAARNGNLDHGRLD